MKRVLICLMAITALVNYSCKDNESNSDSTHIEIISPEEMKQISKIDDVQLVDVRTPEEYKEEYIEGFQNIDYYSKSFDEDIEKLDKEKPVIVYCRTGRRSSDCAKDMEDKGFVKIYDLEGGITKRKYMGYEVRTKGQP